MTGWRLEAIDGSGRIMWYRDFTNLVDVKGAYNVHQDNGVECRVVQVRIANLDETCMVDLLENNGRKTTINLNCITEISYKKDGNILTVYMADFIHVVDDDNVDVILDWVNNNMDTKYD